MHQNCEKLLFVEKKIFKFHQKLRRKIKLKRMQRNVLRVGEMSRGGWNWTQIL